MSDAAFEAKVGGIFTRTEQRLGGRLSVEKAKSENLQSVDTRRVAFILTEAIEAELTPAVKDALASYDEAINRPLQPNDRWERALVRRIDAAVDASVKLALALDKADHPWKPLLVAEGPKLKERLSAMAEKHFTALGKHGGRRRGASQGLPDGLVWAAIFAAGVVAGALAMRFIAG